MVNVIKRITALMMTIVMIMTIALSAPGLTMDVSAASQKYVKSLKVKKSVTVTAGKSVTVKPTVKVVKKSE